MFSLRNFIMQGFINAIGKMADYQIILNAAGWLEKNVLQESDLETLQDQIQAYNEEQERIAEEKEKAAAAAKEEERLSSLAEAVFSGIKDISEIDESDREAVEARVKILQEQAAKDWESDPEPSASK